MPHKTKSDAGANTEKGKPSEDDDRTALDMTLTFDPFPVDEPLVLMPEEAVFLSFALGCLVVSDEVGRVLSIDVSETISSAPLFLKVAFDCGA